MKSRSFKEHTQTQAVTDARWVQFDGSLNTVDIANDQTVIGTNSNDDIYLIRIGIGGQWGQLPGKLRQVSTGGKDKYFGVNAQDQIFFWH